MGTKRWIAMVSLAFAAGTAVAAFLNQVRAPTEAAGAAAQENRSASSVARVVVVGDRAAHGFAAVPRIVVTGRRPAAPSAGAVAKL